MKSILNCFVLPTVEGNIVLPERSVLEFAFLKQFNSVVLKEGLLLGLYNWQTGEVPVVMLGLLEPVQAPVGKIHVHKKQKIAILQYPTQAKKAITFGFLLSAPAKRIQVTEKTQMAPNLKPVGLVQCFCTISNEINMIPNVETLVEKLVV